MSTLRTECTHHGPVERVQKYVSLGSRLRRRLQRDAGDFRAVHWPDSFDLRAPAKGDGYDFSVIVHFTWCVTGHAYGEALAERAKEHRTRLLERTVTAVRGVSRAFSAYEAGHAESRIHEAVGELFAGTRLEFMSGRHSDGDARPIDHRTILLLDTSVRAAQREATTQWQKAVNEHELASLLARQFGGRRLLWQHFLESGQREWLTPYAVALAEDPGSVAEVVRQMTADRRRQAEELADHVVEQVGEYQARDAFDLMMQNDRVLRHLMELIGVPGLPPPAPSPFEER